MSFVDKMCEEVFHCNSFVLDEFAKHFTVWKEQNGVMYGAVDYHEFNVKIRYTYRGIPGFGRTPQSIDRVEVKVVCRYLCWEEKYFYETECGRRFSIVHGRFGDILRLV